MISLISFLVLGDIVSLSTLLSFSFCVLYEFRVFKIIDKDSRLNCAFSNMLEESDIEKKYYCENIFSTKNKEQIKSSPYFSILFLSHCSICK